MIRLPRIPLHGNPAIRISAVFGLLGCALGLLATARYGIGLSSDSVTYLAGARNIVEGRGYANFNGAPILAFPPLFSALIGLLSAGLFPPDGIARLVNALCFGLSVFLSAYWSFRHLRSFLLASLGATAVLFSGTLLEISVYAWSEPLFLLLTLSMLLQLERDDFADSSLPWVLTGLLAGLAILTRYAGITVVLTGAMLLAVKRTHSTASLMRRLSLFLSIAMLPIGLWFYRNYALSSTLTGHRAPAARTILQSADDLLHVLSSWLLPESVPFRYRDDLLLVLTVVFVSIILVRLRTRRSTGEIGEVAPFLLFIGIYTSFMLYTTSRTALSPIDGRYMSPIFIPLLLSLMYLLDRTLDTFRLTRGAAVARALPAVLLAVWLLHPISTTYRALWGYLADGAGGFHSTYWVESDLISYLKTSELSGTIYTNEPSAVYALTGRSYHPSPEKLAYESDVPTDDLLRFEADLRSQGVLYIVWFDTDWWKGYLYDLDELGNVCKLEQIAARQDGAVYRISLSDCRPPT